MTNIGIYICHCGTNIAGMIDVEELARKAAKLKDVSVVKDYRYLCSDPGQDLIKEDIRSMDLDRVVVAACSPRMHESTYRKVLSEAGINPFLLEIANIREQASWVHSEKEKTTEKAFDLVRIAVAKVKKDEPLESLPADVIQRVLVIGAGIAGIQTSLDIANIGYEVVLVEKEQSIGGRMSQLGKTFPTLDCSACILTPRMVEVSTNPKIRLHTYSEVEEISGFIGNFHAKIRKKSRGLNPDLCTGCGECTARCPTKVPGEYDEGMGKRKAIYTLFPQAVPNVPVIDRANCVYITKGKCGICKKVCPAGAIDYELGDEIVEEEVGAVVVASGFDPFDPTSKEELGYGRYKNVITGLQLERLLHTAGPTKGEVIRPSDGAVPKRIAFVQCVGSRDEHANKYCSRVCCMHAIKNALLIKEHHPDAEIFIYYIDIRAFGKGYEEFYKRTQEHGIKFMRGRVAEIFEENNGNVVVRADDTLLGMVMENEVDMAVLSVGMVPRSDSAKIQKLLGIATGSDGFFMEAHAKLRPVETLVDGVFLAGTAQGPKDIPDTVAQAKGAASSALGVISHKVLELSPLISEVDERLCRGCGDCKDICEYGAIELITLDSRNAARINPALCKGCGACTVACCNGSIKLRNFTDTATFAMLEAVLGGEA
ncbi:MAG TPA: CoB--CoM heterodisulfide reductase iron-sulfur subunit A family protein [Candidatus Methanoperedens sp.]|nr:CoB--CoM heterodisulfide reductase iron-sulfur subunit A family protein [Candidatus Methanoperedens sp.]